MSLTASAISAISLLALTLTSFAVRLPPAISPASILVADIGLAKELAILNPSTADTIRSITPTITISPIVMYVEFIAPLRSTSTMIPHPVDSFLVYATIDLLPV